MAQRLFGPLLLSFMVRELSSNVIYDYISLFKLNLHKINKVVQVLRAQQIFYLDGNYFLNPYHYLRTQLGPGFRSGRENLHLPKEQLVYCNTEPSRPIPSSANNVRTNLQQPYLVKIKESELKFVFTSCL